MPLSPAHPAVVLPLRPLGLPLSALVVGAVAPDAPVFLPIGVDYATTHSGPGVAVDVVIGLVLLWLWSTWVRDAVVDVTAPLRNRLPVHARLERRGWLLAPLALAIGAGSHVLWDSATHDWGFLVQELEVLREPYGPLPGYRWLQHTSTVLGSAVVAAYGVRHLRRRALAPRPAAVPRPRLWWAPVPVVTVGVAVVARDPEVGVGAGLVTTVAVACAWRALRQRRP